MALPSSVPVSNEVLVVKLKASPNSIAWSGVMVITLSVNSYAPVIPSALLILLIASKSVSTAPCGAVTASENVTLILGVLSGLIASASVV